MRYLYNMNIYTDGLMILNCVNHHYFFMSLDLVMVGCEACCVCGSYIDTTLTCQNTFREDEKWEKYGEEGFLLMDAKELEGKYFDDSISSIWTSFYRLSMCLPLEQDV